MKTIVGVFDRSDRTARAVDRFRREGLGEVSTYSPTGDHEVLHAHRHRTSPVRSFTLIGGILGLAVGVGLPVYAMLDLPLIVGGRPTVSIPPLVILGFELSMLGAALGGLMGFLIVAGLPRFRGGLPEGPSFTDDRFGVQLTCTDAKVEAVKAIFEELGADEVVADG